MSADPMEVLAAAVRAGDAAGARAALAAHPVLKNRLDEAMPGGSFGATALLTAVHQGDREMAELLLDAGADIDARSHWWAGSFGVLDGESPLVPWLIERGARVDAYAAARHGMLDRLSGLIEADPTRVGQRGGDGQTPLHVARTVAIAAYLLDHGADIDALDVDHESTPAMYLVSEHPDVARFLVSRGCRTDILLASALGDLPAVRKHLEQDPASIERSVSEEDFPKRNPRAGGTIYLWTLGYHKTPQMLAREFEHEEVFRYLMERTPALLKLALACEWGDVAEVERLLAEQPGLAGGLPDRMAKRLVSAAQNGNLAAVRLMLKAGWPVDTRGNDGGTAMHWAAFHGNAEMVREILRHRPDLTLRDPTYQGTALEWGRYGAENSWKRESGNYAETIALLRE
jgi:ankyrin repeat protein